MRINELDHYQDEHVAVLKDMFQAMGNCPMNGYLGEDLDRMAYDEDGNFHFSTEHHGEDFVTQSRGVVYGNNLLVKQKTKSHDMESYSLYSWDTEEKVYTYLSFDYPGALKRFFETIKRFGVNLCEDDISQQLKEMGLTLENVTQIRLNQSVNPMDMMFEEQSSSGDDSFTK